MTELVPKTLARMFVPGLSVPQGSMKSFVVKKTGRVVTPQSKRVVAWRATIAEHASKQNVFVDDGAVGLRLIWVLPRPKSARKRSTDYDLAAKQPDIDKLERTVLDALQGVWFRNDSQVVRVCKDKVVGSRGTRSGVMIQLWDLRGVPFLPNDAWTVPK